MKSEMKVVSILRHEMPKKLEELRGKWIMSVLTDFKVPAFMLDKALSDPELTSQAWRNYLFDNFGIQVTYAIPTEEVSIIKINFENGASGIVGQWLKPDVEYMKGEVGRCKLHLNYWSAK